MTLANLSILKTGKARAIRFSTLDAICEALSYQTGDILEFELEQAKKSYRPRLPNEAYADEHAVERESIEHASRIHPWVGRSCHSHDGSGTGRRQDCPLQWNLFLGLDAHRARRDLELLHHPVGARPVGPAAGPVAIVRYL